VVGSNIANVLLILGGAGIIRPIIVRDRAFHRDAVVLVAGSLLFAGLCWRGVVRVWSGALLLAVFLAFLAHAYWRETRGGDAASHSFVGEAQEAGIPAGPWWLGWAALILGIAGVIFGADILVGGGVEMARTVGVSEEVIGLTLFAVGTSLPELAVSIRAVARGHADMALGNIVGSNLFNVLGIIGAVAVVAPLPVPDQIRMFDLWVMLGATLLLLPYLLGCRSLRRLEAAAILAAYGAYVAVQGYGVSKLFPSLG
jgi:cation:H+ antiporter